MCDKITIEKLNKEISIKKLCMNLDLDIGDVVFIAGSLIEGQISECSKGMGNVRSDVDVFVITKNIENYQNVVYDEEFYKTTFFSMDEISYDVEIYDYHQIMQFFDTLCKINFSENDSDEVRTINLFNLKSDVLKKYMSFTHRFLNSIPISNFDEYNNIKNSICKANYYLYNVRLYINLIDLYYEDVIGYIEEKQGVLAIAMARNLLLYAIGAYLFSNKISFDREKWIPLLLENYANCNDEGKDVFEDFKEFFLGKELGSNMEYIKLAKKILMWINNLVDSL